MSQTVKLTYTWGVGLLNTLNQMRLDHQLCDLKLILQDDLVVNAHSCVLAAASPFLKSVLIGCENPEINMEDFPAQIVQQIIEFIYSGETVVRKPELLLLHSVAASLQVPVLAELAQKMILQSVTQTKPSSTSIGSSPMVIQPTELSGQKEFNRAETLQSGGGTRPQAMKGILRTKPMMSKTSSNLDSSSSRPKRKIICPSRYSPDGEGPVKLHTSSGFADNSSSGQSTERRRVKRKSNREDSTKPNGSELPQGMSPIVRLERLDRRDRIRTSKTDQRNISNIEEAMLQDIEIKEEEIDDDDDDDDDGNEMDGDDDDDDNDYDDHMMMEDADDSTSSRKLSVSDNKPIPSGRSSVTPDRPVDLPATQSQEVRTPTATEISTTEDEFLQQEVLQLNVVVTSLSMEGTSQGGKKEKGAEVQDEAKHKDTAEQKKAAEWKNTADKVDVLVVPRRRASGVALLHKIPVSKGPVYTCQECGMEFTVLEVYQKHCSRHLAKYKQKQFSCEFCSYSAAYKSVLDEHVRIHTGERPYACKFCEKTFKYKKSHSSHEDIHIGRKFTCSYCDKQVSSRSYLNRHIKVHHLNQQRAFKCPTCSKLFHTSSRLKTHIETHNEVATYNCVTCRKLFYTKVQLMTHVLKNHKNRPRYSCPQCGKTYMDLKKIKSHSCCPPGIGKKRNKQKLKKETATVQEPGTERSTVQEPGIEQSKEERLVDVTPEMHATPPYHMYQLASGGCRPVTGKVKAESQVMVVSSSTQEEEINDTDGETSSEEEDNHPEDIELIADHIL